MQWVISDRGIDKTPNCYTMYNMKNDTLVAIRLPRRVSRDLDALAKELGCKKSEILRDAIERKISLMKLNLISQKMQKAARKKGIFTDEDVSKWVS